MDEPLQPGFMTDQDLADLLFRRVVRRIRKGVVEANGSYFRLVSAVRVVLSRGEADPYGLVAAVETCDDLTRAGASFVGREMRVGHARYLVERGMIVSAV
jgi:hypothetical protein